MDNVSIVILCYGASANPSFYSACERRLHLVLVVLIVLVLVEVAAVGGEGYVVVVVIEIVEIVLKIIGKAVTC